MEKLLHGWNKLITAVKPKQTSNVSDLCCLSLNPEGVQFAHINSPPSKIPELRAFGTFPIVDKEALLTSLKDFVKEYNLNGATCSLILQPSDYNLLLMDELPVPAEEMRQALQWRVKELVDIPLADIVLDYFQMPAQAGGSKSKNLNVVVSNIKLLTNLVQNLTESGLLVNIIDIPELALRNICSLYDGEQRSTSLVYLGPGKNQLIITRENKLFFSRRLSLDLANESNKEAVATTRPAQANEQLLDKLALEIQRSFDYYQSQLRQIPPEKLILATAEFMNTDIINYLASRLSCKVQKIDLLPFLSVKDNLTEEQQAKYLLVIGGALRKEVGANATAN